MHVSLKKVIDDNQIKWFKPFKSPGPAETVAPKLQNSFQINDLSLFKLNYNSI